MAWYQMKQMQRLKRFWVFSQWNIINLNIHSLCLTLAFVFQVIQTVCHKADIVNRVRCMGDWVVRQTSGYNHLTSFVLNFNNDCCNFVPSILHNKPTDCSVNCIDLRCWGCEVIIVLNIQDVTNIFPFDLLLDVLWENGQTP